MTDVVRKKKALKFPDRIRKIPAKTVFHASVLERLLGGNYQPANLGLKTYDVDHVKEAFFENQYRIEPTDSLNGSESLECE